MNRTEESLRVRRLAPPPWPFVSDKKSLRLSGKPNGVVNSEQAATKYRSSRSSLRRLLELFATWNRSSLRVAIQRNRR